MNETFDPITLIMIAAAVVVFFKLRSVLGQKTGHQEPLDPFRPRPGDKSGESASDDKPDIDDENVIQMPGTKSSQQDQEEPDQQPDWEGVADKDGKVIAVLEQIQSLDHGFAAKQFLDGAKAAYEMIVIGFAEADKKSLKSLLSKEVFAGFSAAIDDRKKQNLEMMTQFVGINEAEIVNAEIENKKALITIRFVSEMVSAVRDSSGKTVEGDPTEVQTITDVWTFERNLTSRDPNWRLVATDGEEA